MVTEEIVTYIKKRSDAGISREQMITELQGAGWEDTDIAEIFSTIDSTAQETVPIEPLIQVSEMSASEVNTQTQPLDVQQEKMASEENPTADVSSINVDESPVPLIKVKEKIENPGLKYALLGVLGILVIGVAALGMYFLFVAEKTPVQILMYSMINQIEVTSAHVTSGMDIEVEITPVDTEVIDSQLQMVTEPATVLYTMDIDSFYETVDKENIKIKADIDIGVEFSMGAITMAVNEQGGMRLIDNVLYAVLTKSTPIGEFDLTPHENKWIKLDIEKIAEKYLDESLDTSIEETKTKIDPALQAKIMKKAVVTFTNPEIAVLLNEGVTFVGDGKEQVNGINTHHLHIAFTKEQWKLIISEYVGFFAELVRDEDVRAIIAEEDEEMLVMIDEAIDALDSFDEFSDTPEFDKFVTILENLHVDMWIGKKDYYPYKTVIAFAMDDIDLESEGVFIDVDVRYEFVTSEINKPILVVVPPDAMDIEPLIADFYEAEIGTSYNEGVWMSIEPIQCGENPWEKAWLEKEGNFSNYPKDASELIANYYASKGVTIIEMYTETFEEREGEPVMICEACSCAAGYTLYVNILEESVPVMDVLGFDSLI